MQLANELCLVYHPETPLSPPPSNSHDLTESQNFSPHHHSSNPIATFPQIYPPAPQKRHRCFQLQQLLLHWRSCPQRTEHENQKCQRLCLCRRWPGRWVLVGWGLSGTVKGKGGGLDGVVSAELWVLKVGWTDLSRLDMARSLLGHLVVRHV